MSKSQSMSERITASAKEAALLKRMAEIHAQAQANTYAAFEGKKEK